MIGGQFGSVQGAPRGRVARLQPNGTLDPTFDCGLGANHVVTALALLPDNRVYIGGQITNVAGVTRHYIARLQAINVVMDLSGHHQLLADNPVLRRSIDVRNPYVDPINLLQVELLRRLRSARDAQGDEAVWLRRALLVTINGVAAGMRYTG